MNTLSTPTPPTYSETLAADAADLSHRIEGANGRLLRVLARATGDALSGSPSDEVEDDRQGGVLNETKGHLTTAHAAVTQLRTLLDELEALI